MWYINYPAHEKRAEDRIHKYMDAQGIDKHNVFEKIQVKIQKQVDGQSSISLKMKKT